MSNDCILLYYFFKAQFTFDYYNNLPLGKQQAQFEELIILEDRADQHRPLNGNAYIVVFHVLPTCMNSFQSCNKAILLIGHIAIQNLQKKSMATNPTF